jgi:hypothetical protein
MQKAISNLFVMGLLVSCLVVTAPAANAQNEPIPEECEAAKIWETTREERIEQEFQRRGISYSVQQQVNRAEVERIVDERIRILKELCAQKKK